MLVPGDLIARLEAIEAAVFDIQNKMADIHAVFQGLQSVLPGFTGMGGPADGLFSVTGANLG